VNKDQEELREKLAEELSVRIRQKSQELEVEFQEFVLSVEPEKRKDLLALFMSFLLGKMAYMAVFLEDLAEISTRDRT